jgi:hypothetical protein
MAEFIYPISLYLGIIGFLALTFSFLTGMRYIKIKAKYRVHKKVGIVGFTAMFIHASVMLYFFIFS